MIRLKKKKMTVVDKHALDFWGTVYINGVLK